VACGGRRAGRVSRLTKLTRAGGSRDLWRVVGPGPTQPATRARGRVVLADCPCPHTRTGDAAAAARSRKPCPLPTARSGCERRRISGDRCGRSARPTSTAVAPRNHPQIGDGAHVRGSAATSQPAARRRRGSTYRGSGRGGDLSRARPASTEWLRGTTPRLGTAPSRAGTSPRLNLPRGSGRGSPAARPRPRSGVLASNGLRRAAGHPAAARFTPVVGEQRMAADSGGARKRDAPATPAPAGSTRRAHPRRRDHLARRQQERRPRSRQPGAPPHGARNLLPLQRDLQPDLWIQASRTSVPPPGFGSGMRKTANAAGQFSRVGRKGGDRC
jgi:hypothetical protein